MPAITIENVRFSYANLFQPKPPFNNPKVRQAVAYALPYDKMYDTALYGRGAKLYGAGSSQIKNIAWPQPTGYKTDLAKAKALCRSRGWDDFLFYFDTNKAYMRAMNVVSMPHLFLYDKNGKLVYTHIGYTPGDEILLWKEIKKLD